MASLETASDNPQGQDDSGCVQDEPSPSTSDAEPLPCVSLLDLSDDVLLWILQYCEASDLKALGFSCDRLATLVCDRSLWCRVAARARPCGAVRLRWYLALAHAQTTTLSLVGHALRAPKSDQGNSNDEEQDRCAICDTEMGPSSSSPCECGRGVPKNNRLSTSENETDTCKTFFGKNFDMNDQPDEDVDNVPIYTVTPALLKQLTTRCPRLHTLELSYCNIDWGVINMSQFPPTLKRLSFRGCKSYRLPKDKSCMFRVHQHLPLLEDLDLSNFDGVEGVTLLPVSKLPALRRLRLRNCKRLREFVAYASLSARYGFRHLKILDIRGSSFSDAEISAFGWLPLLEELYMTPEFYEKGSPFPPTVSGTELENWELEEPLYFAARRLPPSAPASPPPASPSIFDGRPRHWMPPLISVDEMAAGGNGEPAAGYEAAAAGNGNARDGNGNAGNVNARDGNGNARDGNGNARDGNGNAAAGNGNAADGNGNGNLGRGVRRNIRGRDVIFLVGGHPVVEGLPATMGNVIIMVGGRNADNDPMNDARRNDAANGAPRNDGGNGAPRNDAPDGGAAKNDAENVAQLNDAGNCGSNANADNRNDRPNGSSDDDDEDEIGDGPPAKKKRLSVPSSRNSYDNSMESISNASIDNNAGSSNDAGPSNYDNRPRRFVKFRRNLPPVVVTENENDPNQIGPDANQIIPDPNQIIPDPNQIIPDPNQFGPDPNLIIPDPNLINPDPNQIIPDPNLIPDMPAQPPNAEAHCGNVSPRRPCWGHPVHAHNPLQHHRFVFQIENELEHDRAHPRRENRSPFGRHERLIPGCLLGARNTHWPIHPALLVTDVTLKKFGHSDDEDEHVIRIDQGLGLGHSDRPKKSKLKRLVCSGYVRITNRSLFHLATAAPELVFVDMRGTKVDEAGAKGFKALRPGCEVLYDDEAEDP